MTQLRQGEGLPVKNFDAEAGFEEMDRVRVLTG
jgi:hypothetical protein